MMRDMAAEADGKIDLNSQRKIPLQSSVLTKDRLIVKKQLKHTRKGQLCTYLYFTPFSSLCNRKW